MKKVLLLLAMALTFGMNAQSYYKLDNTEMKARIFIKQEVKSMVKNPKSLDFDSWHFERRDNKAYAIWTFYAENSFGGTVKARAYSIIGLNSDGSIKTATEVRIKQ